MRKLLNPPHYNVSFGQASGRRIRVRAGSRGVWQFRFVCGEHSITPGGSVSFFCEVPKFWLAVNLQRDDPVKEGYVWARTTESARFELRDIPDFYKRLLLG